MGTPKEKKLWRAEEEKEKYSKLVIEIVTIYYLEHLI
jgi:hypothetical protein